MGQRISNMTHLRTGQPIDPGRNYVVSGWASVNENTKGPAIYDLLEKYVQAEKTVHVPMNNNIEVVY